MLNNGNVIGPKLSTNSKTQHTAKYKALLPRRNTKAMISTLISSGVIVIGLQVYCYLSLNIFKLSQPELWFVIHYFLYIYLNKKSFIYFNFTKEYDANSLPSQNYEEAWADFYTAMIMSSASANVLVGLFLMCVLRAGRRLLQEKKLCFYLTVQNSN